MRTRTHEDITSGIEAFLENLRARDLRPATITRRREALRSFTLFLESQGLGSIHDLNMELFDMYAVTLRERGLKPASVDSDLRSVKLLYEYLTDCCIVFENPLDGIVLGRPKPPPVQVITPAQVRQLLDAPDVSTPAGVRDRAILELFYATGMRREEMMALKLGDEDLEAETIIVGGKGDKTRVLPLGTHATAWLRVYIEEARSSLLSGALTACNALWISRFHQAFRTRSIGDMIHQHRKRIGLRVKVTPHTLRRSCATHLLNNGASPFIVANLLGHADLKSLSHYLRIPTFELRNMHRKTPPGT